MDKSKKGNPSTLAEKIREITHQVRLNPPEIIDQRNNETLESEEDDTEMITPHLTSTEPQLQKHGARSHDGYHSFMSALNIGSQITVKGHETKRDDMKPRFPLKFSSDEESISPKFGNDYYPSARNETELDSSSLQESSSDDALDTWLKEKVKRYYEQGYTKRVTFFAKKESSGTKDKVTKCIPKLDAAGCSSPMNLHTAGENAEIIPEKKEPAPKSKVRRKAKKIVHRRAVKKYANMKEVHEALRKISEDRKKLMEIPIHIERLLERSTADDLSELANY